MTGRAASRFITGDVGELHMRKTKTKPARKVAPKNAAMVEAKRTATTANVADGSASGSPEAPVGLSRGLILWVLDNLTSAKKTASKLAAITSAAATTKDLDCDLGQSSVHEFFDYHFDGRDNLATLRDVTRHASEINSIERELRQALNKAGHPQAEQLPSRRQLPF
jgi:hypothetical protein